MKLFKKVSIIGTGLIGGSIALAIKKKRLADRVVGVAKSKKTLLLAKKIGAIDSGSQNLRIIKGSDLIILAAPVATILDLAPKILKIAGKSPIVTDVGSTKEEISDRLLKVFPNYVGGHPLAGSEKHGITYASGGIFKDTLCILTPTKNTDAESLKKICEFWAILGTKIAFLSPKAHDEILSFVSHLPHITAFSLINTVPEEYLRFASNGLRDTTRIAASDSLLWADIFFSNRNNVLKSLGELEKNLARIKSAIKSKNRKLLDKILTQAQRKREVF